MKLWREPLDKAQIKVPDGHVHIVADQCKGCGFCVAFCPRHVLVLSDGYNKKGYHPPLIVEEAECPGCKLCEIICPEFSIFVTLENNHSEYVENTLTVLEEVENVES